MMRSCQLWAFWPRCEPHQSNVLQECSEPAHASQRLCYGHPLIRNPLAPGFEGGRLTQVLPSVWNGIKMRELLPLRRSRAGNGESQMGNPRCQFSHPIQTKGIRMPLVQVKLIEGVFSDAQKAEMVKRLTDTMVSIEGENMHSVTWVIVEEVKSGHWGIGGNALTTDAVKALAAGKG